MPDHAKEQGAESPLTLGPLSAISIKDTGRALGSFPGRFGRVGQRMPTERTLGGVQSN